MAERVVLDTNILVAAGFNARSNSATLIRSIALGEMDLVWDQATRAESKRVIEQIPRLSWSAFEGLFLPRNEFVGETHPASFGLVEDRSDRKFAALAAAVDAILVSNDDHLLSVRDRISVRILRPRELLTET